MTNFFTYSKDLIRHEIGHWFVAKKLNFEVGHIKLKVIGSFGHYGHNGSSSIYPKVFISNIKDLDIYLEDRICILFAGVATQAYFSENENWTHEDTQALLDTWGIDDQSKIKELSFIFRGILFKEEESTKENELQQLQTINNRCWLKTTQIIDSNKEKIEYLVSKISQIMEELDKEYVITFDTLENWLSERGFD